jgi:hypothetical protein
MIAPDSNKKECFKRALLSWETKHSILAVREDGKFFQVFKILKIRKKISPWKCWKQNRICKKTLHRPHLTCLNCRIRKYVNNEIPQTLQVIPYILLVQTNRERWKKTVCKKLLTIIEVLS